MIKVPFLDINSLHSQLENDLLAVFNQGLKTGRFIGGPMVEDFEKKFAEFCDASYSIGVGSGTDALRFALHAAGVKKGEAVITVPNTFIATTEAISQVGAVPLFIDIDDQTYNMSSQRLQEFLEVHCTMDDKTGRPVVKKAGQVISAIIPVHLYGQVAEMDSILEIAEKYNLMVIEDACQAHGAEYYSRNDKRWEKAGSMGKAAAFSFYPGKNLGAFGEGGAVTTNDEGIAQKISMIRDHGQSKKYYHDIEGYNGRLDAIQAGILGLKLEHLSDWNEQRRRSAKKYNELLNDITEIKTPHEPEWTKSVYHLYVIRVKDRDDLQKFLAQNKIDTGLHYPVPLHLQKAYKDLGYKKGDFPVSESIAMEILSLPMYPGLSVFQQEFVDEKIKEWIQLKK